jgi:tol-pal system protein YbgF
MRIDRLVVALALLLPLGGCYTVGPEEDPVVVKLTQIESRLTKVESKLNNDSLMQLMSQLQATQEELRALRGEVETARNDIESLRGQQRDRFLDLDKRLAAVERTGVMVPGAQPGTPGTGAAPDGGTTGVVPGAAGGATDAQLYDSSFELLKNGRYEEAAQGFQRLLETYPDSTHAGNAQYWLAETLYVRRDFAAALPEFTRVVDQYPRSSKVGDALLKIGFCQYELGAYQEARAALERVVERFPESSAARLANERLDRMRREGR